MAQEFVYQIIVECVIKIELQFSTEALIEHGGKDEAHEWLKEEIESEMYDLVEGDPSVGELFLSKDSKNQYLSKIDFSYNKNFGSNEVYIGNEDDASDCGEDIKEDVLEKIKKEWSETINPFFKIDTIEVSEGMLMEVVELELDENSALDIVVDDRFFSSDVIHNGRKAKAFFKKMSENVFNCGDDYARYIKEIAGVEELQLLFSERNLYSTFAVAIDKITKLHLSEWAFTNEVDVKKIDKQRVVDFWCLNKEGKSGQPINYFLELKQGYYCLTSQSKEGITERLSTQVKEVSKQLKELKDIKPDWNEFDNVYIGVILIHNYYKKNDIEYSEKNLVEGINDSIDKRHGIQLVMSTWDVPESLDIQWEQDKVKSISIAGLILSKQV